jgi:hypothetical protein
MKVQRNPNSPVITDVRPLVEADLEFLRQKSVGVQNRVKNLRDSHHMVARLIAAGLRLNDVAKQTGYSFARIYQLSGDPAMKELVAKYRGTMDKAFEETADQIAESGTRLISKYLRHLHDHFDSADEAGELIPIPQLAKVGPDLMDRLGYGKRSLNTNVNIDFAKALEEVRARKEAQERQRKLTIVN